MGSSTSTQTKTSTPTPTMTPVPTSRSEIKAPVIMPNKFNPETFFLVDCEDKIHELPTSEITDLARKLKVEVKNGESFESVCKSIRSEIIRQKEEQLKNEEKQKKQALSFNNFNNTSCDNLVKMYTPFEFKDLLDANPNEFKSLSDVIRRNLDEKRFYNYKLACDIMRTSLLSRGLITGLPEDRELKNRTREIIEHIMNVEKARKIAERRAQATKEIEELRQS